MSSNAHPRTATRRGLVSRAVAVAAAIALVFTGSFVAVDNTAWAKDYPTWNDVAAARKSEAATQAKILEIQNLIAGLQANVEATQAESETKGTLAQEADQRFQEADLKAQALQKQADTAQQKAAESIAQAGEMFAEQYRSSNGDVTTNLFINAGKADDLLYGMGAARKFTQQTSTIYETAQQDKNIAQSATDQANVAKEALKVLKAEADAALAVAQAAALAAAAALNEQQDYANQLNAQLVVLQQNREATEADYLAGVKVRAAAAAAAAQLNAGEISNSGWARPAGGRITSSFGYRADPYGGSGSSYHLGTDLGNPCGTPIYAAHAGTVSYAGWKGIYGYYVEIANGDGISTAYGHIMAGGILVQMGQDVGVGQQIAKVGETGGATGCHLHFGVLIRGVVTDPVPFMRGQGITLG